MALPTYVQKQYTLRDVQQRGLSLADCLKITSCRDTDLTKYAFYMHPASMAAAVRLLSDESILNTFNLYCQKDPVVTVLIRAAEDLSPNTSRAPSHQSSLAERRKISGGRIVSDIFIQPKIRHISGSTDVITMAPIADIGESEKVTLQLEGGRFETFTKEYLLCKSQSINVFTLRPQLFVVERSCSVIAPELKKSIYQSMPNSNPTAPDFAVGIPIDFLEFLAFRSRSNSDP